MANKKVAFVTGAGGYIGSETARQLAAAGYAIAAFDINAETAQKSLTKSPRREERLALTRSTLPIPTT